MWQKTCCHSLMLQCKTLVLHENTKLKTEYMPYDTRSTLTDVLMQNLVKYSFRCDLISTLHLWACADKIRKKKSYMLKMSQCKAHFNMTIQNPLSWICTDRSPSRTKVLQEGRYHKSAMKHSKGADVQDFHFISGICSDLINWEPCPVKQFC